MALFHLAFAIDVSLDLDEGLGYFLLASTCSIQQLRVDVANLECKGGITDDEGILKGVAAQGMVPEMFSWKIMSQCLTYLFSKGWLSLHKS